MSLQSIYLPNRIFGLRIIFGPFGCGKGRLNAIIACSEMHDEQAYNEGVYVITELEKTLNRTFKRPPQKHFVFTTFKCKDGFLKTYDFNLDTFMLPNKEDFFLLYPPTSFLHGDEGQAGLLCSYDWQKMPRPQLFALARIRHPYFLMTIDVQYLENLNVNVLRYCFELVTPLSVEYSNNCFNQVYETIEVVGVFTNVDKAKEYEKTLNLDLIENFREYRHKGNIHDCYDSHDKLLSFYEGAEDKDFCYDSIEIRRYAEEQNKKIEVIEC